MTADVSVRGNSSIIAYPFFCPVISGGVKNNSFDLNYIENIDENKGYEFMQNILIFANYAAQDLKEGSGRVFRHSGQCTKRRLSGTNSKRP
jgi:hypothetical protein